MTKAATIGSMSLASLGRAALPIVALVSFSVGVGTTLIVAGNTLGYDYQAYVTAGYRLIHGQVLYDPTVNVAGPFAVYLYPPPFALAFVPFAMLPPSVGLWLWIVGSIAMTLAAIVVMPVRSDVRWWVLFLAGLDWPVVYAIKLGQVAPFLLLAFAIGWRSLRSDIALGAIGAGATLVKLQPALLFGWALLNRRGQVIVAGLVVTAVIVAVTLPFTGLGAWAEYVQTVGRVSAPVTTPHVMTPGALAYQAGWSTTMANALQIVEMVVVALVWVYACLRRSSEVGYLTTIVASQLLSPVLWDHYAMLLLLPVAWLLDHGRRWGALIPIATSVPLLSVTPPIVYPIVFAVSLLGPTLVTRRAND